MGLQLLLASEDPEGNTHLGYFIIIQYIGVINQFYGIRAGKLMCQLGGPSHAEASVLSKCRIPLPQTIISYKPLFQLPLQSHCLCPLMGHCTCESKAQRNIRIFLTNKVLPGSEGPRFPCGSSCSPVARSWALPWRTTP